MLFKPDPNLPPRSKRHVNRPPFWLIAAFIILTIASWIPLVVIARARVSTATEPRIQIFQDMGVQPSYKAQEYAPIFQDNRAMRQPVAGTVARGELQEDDHYNRGFRREWNSQAQKWEVEYFDRLPEQVRLTPALLERGQERYEIYCAPCHGLDGYGNGPINVRARELQEPAWIPPTSLHSEAVRQRPDGHLYNTITNGIRSMPPYGSQIATADRWAVVAYVRALQLSQNAPVRVLSREQAERLR